jgi:hypothetical protein
VYVHTLLDTPDVPQFAVVEEQAVQAENTG